MRAHGISSAALLRYARAAIVDSPDVRAACPRLPGRIMYILINFRQKAFPG